MLDALFNADFEHRSYEGKPRTTGITFKVSVQSRDARLLRKQAVLDALRWYANRQESLSDCFGTLWCIKVYNFTPQVIEEDGSMKPSTFINFFEWKYDWGAPIDLYIESKL